MTSEAGDLELSPAEIQNFQDELARHKTHISAVSGAWCPKFIELVNSKTLPTSESPPDLGMQQETLVLASETIYSPSTITAFVSTLLALLAAAESQGSTAKALVAAKKIYFGLGGGVDEFTSILQESGGQSRIVWESEGVGVKRLILEVTRSID